MKKPLTDQDIRNISATASMQAFAAALIEINVRYYSEHLDAADPSSLRAASGVAAAQIRDAAACEAAGDAWPFERACMEVAWLCTTHLREQYVTIGGRSYRKLTPPIPGAGVNADFARAPDGKRETEVREMYESERRELDLLEAIVDILHLVDGLLRDYGLRLAPVALDPLVKIKERCSSALAKHRKERETGNSADLADSLVIPGCLAGLEWLQAFVNKWLPAAQCCGFAIVHSPSKVTVGTVETSSSTHPPFAVQAIHRTCIQDCAVRGFDHKYQVRATDGRSGVVLGSITLLYGGGSVLGTFSDDVRESPAARSKKTKKSDARSNRGK